MMLTFGPLLESPIAQAIAGALIHFLWQGAVVAAAAAALLRIARHSASGRYRIGLAAMALLAAAPVATFAVLISRTPERPLPAAGGSAAILTASVPAGAVSPDVAAEAEASSTPWQSVRQGLTSPATVLPLWLAGVALLSVRLAGGWWVARRLVSRSAAPATDALQSIAARVAMRLELSRAVRYLESAVVSVPVTIGWLRPVVLVPMSALSGLSPVQVEALLAHELAHIRRSDYLVNLLQSGVEILFFYHPAVWWISHVVRTEREHCCDDAAVAVCDRLTYATALSTIAAMATPRVALAATDGPLLARIRRILGTPDAGASRPTAWGPLLLLFVGFALAVPTVLVTARAGAPAADEEADQAGRPPEPSAQVQAGPVESGPVEEQSELSAREARRRATTAFLEEQTERARAAVREREARQESQQAEEMRRVLQRLEARLADVQAEELRIEHERAVSAANVKLRDHESELKLAMNLFDALKKRVAAGNADQQELLQAEASVAMLQNRIGAARDELRLAERAHQVRLLSVQTMQEHERLQREYALTMDRAARDQRTVQEAATRDAVAREQALLESAPVQDAATRVQAGDVLVITIENEPDLPRSFVVSADDTIRFPLVGPIRVGGMTLGEARTVLTRALADRGLAASSRIDVGLRRRR